VEVLVLLFLETMADMSNVAGWQDLSHYILNRQAGL
jgi:hypothetical protein